MLTAQVSPGRSGRAFFYDGYHQLGDPNGVPLVDGRAVLSVSTLSPGLHSLTVDFSCGTPLCTDRQSSVALGLDIAPVQVTTTLSTPGPVAYPAQVTITAQVTPVVTTGRLVFLDGDTPIGTVTEHDGTASLTSVLHGGSHQVSVRWESDQSLATVRSTAVSFTVRPITPSIKFTMTDIGPTPDGGYPRYQYVELRAALNPPTAIGTMLEWWTPTPGCWDLGCHTDQKPMTASKPAGSYVYDDYNWPGHLVAYRVCFNSYSPDYASFCAPQQLYQVPS